MKNSLQIALLLMGLTVITNFQKINAQEYPQKYSSSGIEIIFSFADIQVTGVNTSTVMRFSPVLNLQYLYNIDLSPKFGLFTGMDLRNLGFIFKADAGVKLKHRVYALGLPVGFKFGNLDKGFFIYAGGQIEYAFNYKEKYFLNDSKESKDVYWFTDRVNIFQFSALIGVNLPYGFNLKFKYYFTDLMNTDYLAYDENGLQYKPYGAYESSKVFYFSLNYNLFHPNYKYFTSSVTMENTRADRRTAKRNLF